MIDLVITRFDENIEWSNSLIPYINKRHIYNKGTGKLICSDDKTFIYNSKNEGRESLTILQHIYDNYDKLPDCVVFLQGKLYDKQDHSTLPVNEYFNCLHNQIIGSLRYKDQTNSWLGVGVNIEKISILEWQKSIDICNGQKIYIRCNNFSIGKSIIKKFPKEYYKNLIDNAQLKSKNPFSAYFCELSNIDIFVGKSTYKLLKLDTHKTKNKNDLQGIKGLEICWN